MTTVLKVEGMMCTHCKAMVEKVCKAVSGTEDAVVDLQAKNGIGENALLRTLNLFISSKDPAKLKLAEILIGAGIDVNCRNERGITALMYAAALGNETLIQLLLKHGADKTLKDGQGRTASAYLDGAKYPELTKYF